MVNPISQTSPDRWTVPEVTSNRQSISIQLSRALEDAGHEVTVFMASPFEPSMSDEGVEVKYLPVSTTRLSPPAQLPLMPTLASEVNAGDFDAVVSSEIFQYSTLSLARATGVPPLYVWQEADTFQRMMLTIPARLYYGSAGRMIVKSARGFLPRTERAAVFLRSVGVPAEKMGPEVPNGIDAKLFRPRRELRAERPTILFVGSLIERKNPALAIRAMVHVLERRPEVRLMMKGIGAQERQLRELARELGVESAVTFDTSRSALEEMPAIYNQAWACVFPSYRDFATLSPIEAVACGVPVVLSERLPSAAYLQNRGSAWSATDDLDDVGALLLRHLDEHGRLGLSDGLIKQVVERFSLENAALRLGAYIWDTSRL